MKQNPGKHVEAAVGDVQVATPAPQAVQALDDKQYPVAQDTATVLDVHVRVLQKVAVVSLYIHTIALKFN